MLNNLNKNWISGFSTLDFQDLAEFIINLADKNPGFTEFRKVLLENGAEFADSFIENILRIINHMKPKSQGEGGGGEKDYMRQNLPFLALPDEIREKKVSQT